MIKKRTDFLNLYNLKQVNKEYKNIKVLFKKASKNRVRKLWEDARDKYEKYLKEIYPCDIDAIAEIGEIYSHLGEYVKAIEKFKEAEKLQKYNPFYRIRVAENYLKNKDDKNALKIFEELNVAEPENLTYINNLAVLYVKLKDTKGLHSLIKNLKKIETSTPKSKLLLAQLEKMPEIMRPEISKGIADNTQHQSQQIAVLLFLHMFKNATITQIKNECFKSNLPTTKKIINILKKAQFIKEEPSFGGLIYSLTDDGKKEVKDQRYVEILQDVYSKEKKEDDIGVGGTSSLKNKYREWSTRAKTK